MEIPYTAAKAAHGNAC